MNADDKLMSDFLKKYSINLNNISEIIEKKEIKKETTLKSGAI